MMNILRTLLTILASWILWLYLSQFFFCSRFDFPTPKPFTGSLLYNPYDTLAPTGWVKCNFHAHAQAWNGLTNGHGTAQEVHAVYQSLHYGVHCVSNYHHIDTTFAGAPAYIPAYEHGFNLRKTHQLVLGDYRVNWLDYLLPQTIHNKQNVLQQLSTDPDAVVILNHPGLREGYDPDDLAHLSNFQCIEVLNPAVRSEAHWDAALSAGRRAFVVGNDDSHNVTGPGDVGRACTFVNVTQPTKTQVLQALRNGQSYGVWLGTDQSPTDIPRLQALQLHRDTIQLILSQPAQAITFIGQNGRVLARFPQTSRAQIVLKKEDHYARAIAEYSNGTTLFLNPVFFTNSMTDPPAFATVNHRETLIYRLAGGLIALLWIRLVALFLAPRRAGWGKRRVSFPV